MAAEAIEVQQLLQLAREKSEAARSHLFEVMGDLFQEQSAVLSAQERALMVDILEKLVREVSHDIRLKLSHRLAVCRARRASSPCCSPTTRSTSPRPS